MFPVQHIPGGCEEAALSQKSSPWVSNELPVNGLDAAALLLLFVFKFFKSFRAKNTTKSRHFREYNCILTEKNSWPS